MKIKVLISPFISLFSSVLSYILYTLYLYTSLFTKVLEERSERLYHTEKYKFYLPALSAVLDTDLPRGITIMHERGSGPMRGVIISNDPTTSKG